MNISIEDKQSLLWCFMSIVDKIALDKDSFKIAVEQFKDYIDYHDY